MKITDRRAVQAGKPSAVGHKGSVDARFGGWQPAPAGGVQSPVGALRGVDGVLAIHTAAEPTAQRRRALRRAGELLDGLEQLRLGLLDGRLSRGLLDRLAALLAQDRAAAAGDTELTAAIEAIEQRAAVELAKLDRDAST